MSCLSNFQNWSDKEMLQTADSTHPNRPNHNNSGQPDSRLCHHCHCLYHQNTEACLLVYKMDMGRLDKAGMNKSDKEVASKSDKEHSYLLRSRHRYIQFCGIGRLDTHNMQLPDI